MLVSTHAADVKKIFMQKATRNATNKTYAVTITPGTISYYCTCIVGPFHPLNISVTDRAER